MAILRKREHGKPHVVGPAEAEAVQMLLTELKATAPMLHHRLSTEYGAASASLHGAVRSLDRLVSEQSVLGGREIAGETFAQADEVGANHEPHVQASPPQQFVVDLLNRQLSKCERAEVRIMIIDLLSGRGRDQIAETLWASIEDDPDPVVAEHALRALNLAHTGRFPPDAIERLANLLFPPPNEKNKNTKAKPKGHGPSKEIQLAICSTLFTSGRPAAAALPALLWTFVNSPDEDVKKAAVEAMESIDPAGDYLVYAVRNEKDRNDLLRWLNSGAYERLNTAWNLAKVAVPPPGFKRMHMHDLIQYIYGSGAPSPPADQPQDSKKELKHDSKGKNIRNWIASGHLRAIRIKGAGKTCVYDALLDDLKALRKLYLGSGTPEQDLAEESADSE